MVAATNTEAGVANLALLAVGQRELLDSLDEATTPAEMCAASFDGARDSVLAAFPWRFCRRRAVLASTGQTRSGWAYVYSLPAECITPVEIFPGTRPTAPGDEVPFDLELNDKGTALVLCTDMSPAELSYVYRLKTVALWPPLFVDAVAAQLAVKLALGLPVKPQLAAGLVPAAQQALLRAAAHDNRSGKDSPPPQGESVRARW